MTKLFHFHKFEVRGVNHFIYNNDYVTRVLRLCRCGGYQTYLVPGIWQLDQITPRNESFDKQFLKAARICEEKNV